jgi:hypothetical protein
VPSARLRKPGASPLVFGKFLMASTAFVTLDDIADYLPCYEESVIEVEMGEQLGRAYKHVDPGHSGSRSCQSREPQFDEPDDASGSSHLLTGRFAQRAKASFP